MNFFDIYDDTIIKIAEYCDEYSKYFITLTCRRLQRLVNFYDIDLLYFPVYAAKLPSRNVMTWIMTNNMVTITEGTNELIIKEFAKKHKKKFLLSVYKSKGANEVFIKNIVKYKVDIYDRIEWPQKLSRFDIVALCIKYKNYEALIYLSKNRRIQFTRKHIVLAVLSEDTRFINLIFSTLARPICICKYTTCKKNMTSWCRQTNPQISHSYISESIKLIDSGALDIILVDQNEHNELFTWYGNEGNIEILKLLTPTTYHMTHKMMNNINIIKYLYSITDMRPILNKFYQYCENLEVLKYIYDNSGFINNQPMTFAVIYGNMETLMWLESLLPNQRDDPYWVATAISAGHTDAAKYLIDNGYNCSLAREQAYYNCNGRILKYLDARK